VFVGILADISECLSDNCNFLLRLLLQANLPNLRCLRVLFSCNKNVKKNDRTELNRQSSCVDGLYKMNKLNYVLHTFIM